MTRSDDLFGCEPIIAYGWAGRSLRGEAESGDLHLVASFATGALVAVIDGLGHGPNAAAVARAAAAALRAHAGEPVAALVQQCHESLRGTRGVVLSLASFTHDRTMSWVGVGNVEGVLFRAATGPVPARESLILRGGVVGYQVPPLRPVTLPVGIDDTLVLATDGIRGQFTEISPVGRTPGAFAEEILSEYGRESDDALVLVARYQGPPP